MPAFNFQKQFADDVEHGRKPQTIRAKRKNRPRVGQTAHCFTGMRHPGCRCIGRWPIVRVETVVIGPHSFYLPDSDTLMFHESDCDAFARADGFTGEEDMIAWFKKTHGLPFTGDLVMWEWSEAE